ncbi:hypothetical protein [Nisaea sp.]|uniref:hypothetical protein n=1 Tax=Nisaea sp. TaxID=2024842 RepID=UPI0032EDB475
MSLGFQVSGGERKRRADQLIPFHPLPCPSLASPIGIIALIFMQDSGGGINLQFARSGKVRSLGTLLLGLTLATYALALAITLSIGSHLLSKRNW